MHTQDSPNVSDHQAVDLRAAMVDAIRERGFLTDERVAEALETVPRHLFAPEVTVQQAYDAFDVVRTRYDDVGTTLSSVSAPYIQAMMLEQAAIEPGHRVLEIGSGGYNAALIAELVGRTGQVTTIDLDPEVTDRASRLLEAAGYGRVTVTCRDAEYGVPEYAPYDRIVVTAGAWDVPSTWSSQLAPGGRLVVPLRLRGLTRSLALEHDGDKWRCLDYQLCGFIPVRGAGHHDEPVLELAPGVQLRIDGHQGHLNTAALQAALKRPGVQHWTGVTLASNVPFDELHLWLATHLDGHALLSADQQAVDAGVVDRWARYNAPALADGDSLAYLAPLQPTNDGTRHEFGIRAHGPHGDSLAAIITAHAQQWAHHDPEHHAHIDLYPANTALPPEPGTRVVDKLHTRAVLQWPSPRHPDASNTP